MHSNAKDQHGFGPLHEAAQHNHKGMVKMFLEKGANINLTTNKNETPLLLSIAKGYSDVAKILIKNGADLELKDDSGFTALHEAVDMDNIELTKTLIENGANVDATDKSFYTPLSVAVDNNNEKMVKILTMHPDIDTKVKNVDGDTAFEVALSEQYTSILKILAYSEM